MIYQYKNVFTKDYWQILANNILEADKQFEALTGIKAITNGIVVYHIIYEWRKQYGKYK